MSGFILYDAFSGATHIGPPYKTYPSSTDKTIQYNDNGLFGGSSALTYDKSINSLVFGSGNTINSNNIFIVGSSNIFSSGATNSAIIAATGVTGTESNTLYVQNLHIFGSSNISGGTSTNSYTKIESDSNFLSANTSFYTQTQTNNNFLSAATSFSSGYTKTQCDNNFASASTFYSHTAATNPHGTSFTALTYTAHTHSEYLTGSTGGGGSSNFSMTYYVDDLNGDDVTATGQVDKPFKTIDVAVASAQTGYLIYVMPGSYTATTNLAKAGVSHYFSQEAIVINGRTPTSTNQDDDNGSLFYANQFSVNIRGAGKFFGVSRSVLHMNTGYGDRSPHYFECDTANSTGFHTIYAFHFQSYHTVIKGSDINSSGGLAIYTPTNNMGSGNEVPRLYIDCKFIYSTAERAIYFDHIGYYDAQAYIKGDLIFSTASYGIQVVGSNVKFDVLQCSGTYGYHLNGYNENYTNSPIGSYYINGNSSSIYISSTKCEVINNGVCQYVTQLNGNFLGDVIDGFNISSGYLKSNISNYSKSGSIGSCVVSGGHAVISIIDVTPVGGMSSGNYSPLANITVSSGRLDIHDDYIANGVIQSMPLARTYWTVSGGKLVLHDDLHFTFYDYGSGPTYDCPINLNSGTLEIRGGVKNYNVMNYNFRSSCINKTGGKLILNGATLVVSGGTENYPIICPNSAQDVEIYSAGVNTNTSIGTLLPARKWKCLLSVNAITQPTIFRIDGNTITSTASTSKEDIVADLIVQLSALTLGVTSVDYLDGTFTIESDVAGTPHSVSPNTNMTHTFIRYNSYEITDIIGGNVIENTNITM